MEGMLLGVLPQCLYLSVSAQVTEPHHQASPAGVESFKSTWTCVRIQRVFQTWINPTPRLRPAFKLKKKKSLWSRTRLNPCLGNWTVNTAAISYDVIICSNNHRFIVVSQDTSGDFENLPWFTAVETFCHGHGHEELEHTDRQTLSSVIERTVVPKMTGTVDSMICAPHNLRSKNVQVQDCIGVIAFSFLN